MLDEDVQDMRGGLPLELSELYAKIYDRIVAYQASSGKAIIQNTLKWLLCSQGRLTTLEFRKAISMDVNISLERLSNDHILDLLHDFIVLDNGLDIFRFAHLSLREYSEENRLEYS